MNTSFNVVANNFVDRNFGGTKAGTGDPYLTGTHFVKFYDIPAGLIQSVQSSQGNAGFSSNADIAKFLQGTCLSVTPPGGTLSKVQFVGLGGSKWNVPGNVDYGDSVSMKFIEMSAAPFLAIMHGWVRMIREYRTGLSRVIAKGPTDYKTKSMYSCNILYWTTKPDGVSVEYSALYSGCFPQKDPQDMYGSDVTTVDKIEPDMEFNVDRIWHEDWVKVKAQNEAQAAKDAVLKYRGGHSALSTSPDGGEN